ncbi:MFS transporter [Pseudomonas gingeri]|uniref:MFS transporter n=1 Tax=Pseudomonas gingeri TaxID=117681 RepID=A0A7Y7XGF9_9PSED|nr:MFS transporter [Pseudomonas gingeri]NWB98338.1 MFS transporter [Pseudomonas gingeri]
MQDWLTLARDRRFILLWLATLVSSTGTFILLLSVSAYIIRVHHSGLGATSVFAFQWILPVALASLIRLICERVGLRKAVISSDIINGLLSLLIGVLLAQGWMTPVLICFLFRGFVEAITKTSRVVFIKKLFEGRQLELASSTFNLSYYLGGVLGGVIGSLLVGTFSLLGVAAISAATFAFSALCYAGLPYVMTARQGDAKRRGVLMSNLAIVTKEPQLFAAFGYLCIATGVFQGFHNAARTILPIRVLGLPDSAVMQLQIVSALGIILGALAVSLLPSLVRWKSFGLLANTMTAICLVLTTLVQNSVQLLVAYFLFIFLFEVSFTAAQSRLIQLSSSEDIVTITAGTNAFGSGLLIVCALLSGGLADLIPFQQVGYLVGICSLLLSMLILRVQSGVRKRMHYRPSNQ